MPGLITPKSIYVVFKGVVENNNIDMVEWDRITKPYSIALELRYLYDHLLWGDNNITFKGLWVLHCIEQGTLSIDKAFSP